MRLYRAIAFTCSGIGICFSFICFGSVFPGCVTPSDKKSASGGGQDFSVEKRDVSLDPAVLRAPWDQITRIQVRADHEIVLEKTSSWKVVQPVEASTRLQAIEDLLGLLAEITVLAVHQGGETSRLGLGHEAIELRAFAGQQVVSHFDVGYADGPNTFVRNRKGQSNTKQPVMVAAGHLRRIVARSLSDYRDPRVVSFSYEDVVKVVYTDGEKTRLIVQRDKDMWRAKDEVGRSLLRADSGLIANAVSVLSKLKARDFTDPPIDRERTGLFELTAPAAVITLKNGAKIRVIIGAVQRQLMYVSTSESDQVYQIAEYLKPVLVPTKAYFTRPVMHRKTWNDHDHHHGVNHSASPAPVPLTPQILQQLRDIANDQIAKEKH